MRSILLPYERWSGGAKVSCISRHWGVQLISAYSWARPAILVAGKGRGGMFLFLLFLHFHSCSSFFPSLFFSSLPLSLLSLFSLSLGDDAKWPTRVDVSLNPNTINQLLPYAFVWEKYSEFQTTSSLEPLGQFCTNFIWCLLRLEEWKIAKMVAVHWPRWPPCPYMVKTFKNLLLQNRGHLGAESLLKSSGTGGLPKLLK